MYRFILTKKAEQELSREIEYSEKKWGRNHALSYSHELRLKINNICKTPYINPVQHQMGNDIRAVIHKGNWIIYHINEEKKQIEVLGFPSIYKTLKDNQ